MNNQENMTVITDPQSNNLWLKPPRIFLILIPVILLLIVLGIYFYSKNKNNNFTNDQSIETQEIIDHGIIKPLTTPKQDIGESGVGYPPPGEDE